jgi:hypothetical protein
LVSVDPSRATLALDTAAPVRAEVGADIWSCLLQTGRIGDETRPAPQAPRVEDLQAVPAPGQTRAGHDAASTQQRLEQALQQRQTTKPVAAPPVNTAVPMPTVTLGPGTAVPMPTVTLGPGTAVPMPVLGGGTTAPDALPTAKPDALPTAKPDALPGAKPLPSARPDSSRTKGGPNNDDGLRRELESRLACVPGAQRPRVESPASGAQGERAAPTAPRPQAQRVVREAGPQTEDANRASSQQEASGAREARGQGVGEYAPLREGEALREGTRGPRVAEHQREVGRDLQRLGLSEDAVRGLLDPGGANRGGPFDGFYGPNTTRATQLRDELRRQRDSGQLTPERLRTLERELCPQAAPQSPGDTVTPRAQPRVQPDTVTPRAQPRVQPDTVTPRAQPRVEPDTVTPRAQPRVQPDTVTPRAQPAPACRVPGADVRAPGEDAPRAYVPDTVAALYPERTRVSTGPNTSARPLDAAMDAQRVLDALVHQGADRIPPRVAHDGGQQVTETGRRHSDEVLGVLRQAGLEYARRGAFGDGTPEERAQNRDLAERIRAAQADYARQVREYWSGRKPDAVEPSAQ